MLGSPAAPTHQAEAGKGCTENGQRARLGNIIDQLAGTRHVNLIWSLVSKLKPNGSNTTSPSLAGSTVRVEPSLNVRAKVPMHPPWTAPSVHKEPLLVSPVRFASRFGSEKKRIRPVPPGPVFVTVTMSLVASRLR